MKKETMAGTLLPKKLQMVEIDHSTFSVQLHDENVSVNLSQMAQPFGKVPKDWLRTDESKRYIEALTDRQKCPSTDLMTVVKGGDAEAQGTWVHDYRIAMRFAQWLSPAFSVQVDELLVNLLMGQRVGLLEKSAGAYQERTVITVPMGDWTNKVWVENGVIYSGASTLMKYLGYRDGINAQYISRIGTSHCRSVQVGCQPHWFISYQGFSRLLEISRVIPDASELEAIQRLYNVYVEKAKEDVTGYHFSMSEGFDILKELARTPVRKHRVIELFIKGAKRERMSNK
jgi:hypothetical protein